MADANLKIRIGGDVSGAVSSVNKLKNTLGTLPPAANILSAQIERLQRLISLPDLNLNQYKRIGDLLNKTQRDFNNLTKQTNAAASTFGKVVPGSNQAAFALTNLGRVAQDAPFGFIGIQNNINPLLESFQRLNKETGSAGASFLALAKSLTGAAGIGLGISIVSSLITSAVQKYGSLGNALNELFGSLTNTERAISGLNKAQEESNKKAGSEISRLQILAAVSTDIEQSTTKRARASKELQSILKENNIQISQEAILNGQAAEAIGKATEAILQRARARAIESRLAELQTERLNLEIKEQKAVVELTNKQNDFNKALKAGRFDERSRGFFIRTAFAGLEDVRKDLKNLDEQIDFTLKRVNTDNIDPFEPEKIKTSIDLLKKRLDFLVKIKEATRDIVTITNLEEQIFDLNVKITLRDAAKNGLSKEETDLAIAGFKKQLNDAFQKEALAFESITRIKPVFILDKVNPEEEINSAIAKATGNDKQIKVQLPPVLAQFQLKIDAAENLRKQFIEGVANTLSNALQDTFSQLGSTLGDVLSGGNIGEILAKAGQSFLGIIGGVLQDIGKQVVATSLLVQNLKKALNTLFAPGGASLGIGAGLALIALGGLLKSFKFNVPKFAEGGIATGPTLGVFGEAGKEAIIPLDRLPSLIQQANGNGNINVTGRLTMNSRELVAQLQRAQTSFGRIN